MVLWQTYHLAQSIPDALNTLLNSPGPARLVAGGTDLLLDLQQSRHPAVHTLVDVTDISEMRRLEIRRGQLFVGASVPLNQVVASAWVQQHCTALYEAAKLIGGPQVRNTATLGGNVAHALPAGDGTIALLALEAQAEIASLHGMRQASMQELFLGPGKSSLDPQRELLVGFYLPLNQQGQGSAFRRVMRPQGVAIAILNMAAWVQRDGDRMHSVRIAVGPAGPVPFRARGAEEALRGQLFDEGSLAAGLHALLAEARFRTSPHRSTAQYRQAMAGVLLGEVLSTAWERASLPGDQGGRSPVQG